MGCMVNTSDSKADASKIESFITKRKHGKGYITLENLQDILGTRDQGRIYAAVSPLLEEDAIVPLKNAKGNGSMTVPLFQKYRITPPDVPTHDLTQLNPLLLSTSYLEHHPAPCHEWWAELRMLSSWLSDGRHVRDASLRERCWEVFGNEKAAEIKGLRKCVYNACGKELRDVLMVFDDSPEDLPFVVRPGSSCPSHVIVSENRDPYLSVRRGLLSGKTTLFGVPVDAVVYGRGNVARQNGGASLNLALESMCATKDATVLYWGDIDREGLSILASLCSTNAVRPFVRAYELMLEATKTHAPRTSPDGRKMTVPDIEGLFEHELKSRLLAIADEECLLPQEAIASRAIMEAMT